MNHAVLPGKPRRPSRNGPPGHATIPFLEDRLPPQNLEAEAAVLSALAQDNSIIPALRLILAPGDFFRESHELLYRAALAVFDRGQPVDAITLADELERRDLYTGFGGDEEMASILLAASGPANAAYHAEIVREKARVRFLIGSANELVRDALAMKDTADDLLRSFVERAEPFGLVLPDRPFAEPRPWPEPHPDVWYGLAGEVAGAIAPHTEADPAAILIQFLVGYGSIVGRHRYWLHERTRHYLNEFVCIVGDSAKARKGTSWDHVRDLLANIDGLWAADRIADGLSSGEGLIWAVRDPVVKDGEVIVEGIDDKRLLVVESEFGSTLGILSRDGNSLTGILRKSWDTGSFRSMTKNMPARTTGAHVSIIGHVTIEELTRRLTQTDAANGFANRFLWTCARRSKLLPFGGTLNEHDFAGARNRLTDAVTFGAGWDGAFIRDPAANQLWGESYATLTRVRPGLLGSVTSRAEPHVMRLSCLYAALDCSPVVGLDHLKAALALWNYCDLSAAFIFGDLMGNPDLEKLIAALDAAGESGLNRRQLHLEVFGGHKPAKELDELLRQLLKSGQARRATLATRGRPAEMWYVARPEQ